MPIDNVNIARVNDGLILVTSVEHNASPLSSGGGESIDVYRNQAKHILRKLNPGSASRMSIESNPYIFHYIIENGICYLILTDKSYPKRLAFLFLEDVAADFVNSLKDEYGEDWQRTVETIGRQYAFIKFDRIIQKRRREYSDPTSMANVQKVTNDLNAIQDVMRKTIDDVLDRGNKLEDVGEMSKNLASESKRYRWSAKKLSTMALYKKYAPYMGLAGILILIGIINYYIL